MLLGHLKEEEGKEAGSNTGLTRLERTGLTTAKWMTVTKIVFSEPTSTFEAEVGRTTSCHVAKTATMM